MKVCRMCWSLLDAQLNRCNCTQGADPSVFFKDTSEMVNHFVTHERLMSKQARKLQELVKKMIKSNGKDLKHRQKPRSYQGWCAESIIDETLQSLVEKSEKTDKEKSREGKL